MISRNYNFFGKEVNFYLKLSGNYAAIKLEKTGLRFSLTLTTAIFTYLDVDDGNSYELDESGQPRVILDHNDAKSAIDPRFSSIKFILFDLSTKQFLEIMPHSNSSPFIDPRVDNLGFALFDVEKKLFFMQFEGELIPILDPRETDINPNKELIQTAMPVTNSGKISPIASLEVKTELDFSLSHLNDNIPQATVEITIESHHEQFRYTGSRRAAEIIQLQNRAPLSLEFTEVTSNFVPDMQPIAPAIAGIAQANLKAGSLISQLGPAFNQNDNQTLLTSVLGLFNQAVKISLLRLQLSTIFRHPADQSSVASEQSLIDEALKSDSSVKNLLAKIQTELSSIFYHMKNAELTLWLNIFYSISSNLPKARQAALYINNFPGSFLANNYITDPNTLKKLTTAIVIAINTIKSALDTIAVRKRFQLLHYQQHPAYTDINSIPKFFPDYLVSVIENTLAENPLLNSELLALANAITTNKTDLQESELYENNFDTPRTQLQQQRETRDGELTILRHSNFTHSISRLAVCGGEPEKVAALLLRNPFIKAVNDGLGLHEMFSLILSLYPEASQKALPYLVITDVVGGVIGALIGRHAILNPRSQMHPLVRIWEGCTDGLIVFVFSLNAGISIYLTLNPEAEYISNQVFWSQIASVPLFFMTSYSTWHCISPQKKEHWFKKNPALKNTLDVLNKFLLYSGIFQYINLRVLPLPNTLAWELSPIIPGAVMTAINKTRFAERTHGVMTYLASVNLLYTFVREIMESFNSENEEDIVLASIRCVFWGTILGISSYFVLKNTFRFIEEYRGDPEIIIQRATLEELTASEETTPLTSVLDDAQYQSLLTPSASTSPNEAETRSATLTWMRQQHHAASTSRLNNYSTFRDSETPSATFDSSFS